MGVLLEAQSPGYHPSSTLIIESISEVSCGVLDASFKKRSCAYASFFVGVKDSKGREVLWEAMVESDNSGHVSLYEVDLGGGEEGKG